MILGFCCFGNEIFTLMACYTE